MIDYVIGGLVLIAVVFAIRQVMKNRNSGGCGCGCAGCASEKSCHVYEKFEAEAKAVFKDKNQS
jgi:uncharacterized membrane protein